MALRKIAISVGPELDYYLDTRLPKDGNVSGAINTLAKRYSEIVRWSLPYFTMSEWLMLFDVLGPTYNPADVEFGDFRAALLQSVERYGLSDKWRVDVAALAERLTYLTSCEIASVMDAADRFWSGMGGPGMRNSDRVVQIVGLSRLRSETK